jgi:type VI secretion system protein ImpC
MAKSEALPERAGAFSKLAAPQGWRADLCIARLDQHIRALLDAVLHAPQFQRIEAAWRGLRYLVDHTDFRENVRIELLDVSKEALQQDFEDTPEVIQSGLYWHTYIQEYDTPGGEPIGAIISNYEFGNSAQDITLLRHIAKVAAAAHTPFIGAVGPRFFGKETMAQVVAIREIEDHLDRPEYLRWKHLRETDDARYIGLTLPRVLGRLPHGPDTLPRAHFDYEEDVKAAHGVSHLWVNASFAFGANLVRSFTKNGWCVQIRGPHAGGQVEGLPVDSHDLGASFYPKISMEALISETREVDFANLGFIPLALYGNLDLACFFSANSVQNPARHELAEATANSRINARLPYIFLLSRIAHYLKMIQRENIGMTKDRRLLEVELNNWIRNLVTEMTHPADDLQASHPLRDARVSVDDIEDNPGFFRIKLFVVPHFQVEALDIGLSLVSQMPKARD